MKRWKYIISVISLIGITLSFLLLLDYYKQLGFGRHNGTDISKLELMAVKDSYTPEEIVQTLLNGDYQYFDQIKNSKSDEYMLEEAYNNIHTLLKEAEDTSLFKAIAYGLKETEIYEMSINRHVGYVDGESVVFNLVSIWTESVYVIYEEETGVITLLEYHIDRNEAESGLYDENTEEIYKIMATAAGEYYSSIKVSDKNINIGVYEENGNRVVISLTLQSYKETDKIYDNMGLQEQE